MKFGLSILTIILSFGLSAQNSKATTGGLDIFIQDAVTSEGVFDAQVELQNTLIKGKTDFEGRIRRLILENTQRKVKIINFTKN